VDALRKLSDGAPVLATLFLKTMIEETADMTMLEAALTPELRAKARQMGFIRDMEAEARAEARIETRAEDLKNFLRQRGDKPTKHAFKIINASRDADELSDWLTRAWQGETSAELFPEPKSS
jgi:hypothetical protein